MLERELKKEYEDILLGRKKNYSNAFFDSNNEEKSQKNAIIVLRYVFEDFLHWTPKDIENCISPEIITLMKLDSVIKHITFPGELNPRTDLWYIAHLLYPNIIKFNSKEKTIMIYQNILDKKLYRYPKTFWDGPEGIIRAKACFRYMLQNIMSFHNIEELYAFFANSTGYKAMKTYHLIIPQEMMYDTPLDYLHDSLSQNQRNEFLYHYYKFRNEFTSSESDFA